MAKALNLPVKSGTLYKVIAGSFRDRQHMLDREAYLEDNGMKAVVVETVGSGVTYYRVQAGAFRDRGNAEARLAEVKALGISDAYLCENP